jgi:hypothetical protein
MMRNEQGKNDETRTGEDAGLPARGRVAQEQASESVRNNAQVSIRTLIDEIARLNEENASLHRQIVAGYAERTHAEDLVAELAFEIAASRRQPIATAPKDGICILIFYGSEEIETDLAFYSGGLWISERGCSEQMFSGATHWAPIPKAQP